MPYQISLRSGHPRQQFRRDGRVFIEGQPQVVDVLSERLQRELALPNSWLVCVEIPAEESAQPPEDGAPGAAFELPATGAALKRQSKAELVALAQTFLIDGAEQMTKAELVVALQRKVSA